MSWRLKWLGSLPVLLALLLQTLSATEILALRDPTADARWPARTSITASSGPLPYTRGSWKQCARLSIGNPGGMVAGRWHGSLSVRSGSVVEADIKGAECIVSDASGKVELIQTDENAIEPGDEAAVSFCVSYSKSWEATADIWFEPAQTDNGLFVQVENDGSSGETTRVLMRRQTGNTMFMSDWSSGQCKCVPARAAVVPDVRNPWTSTTVTTSRTQTQSTTTAQPTATTSFTTSRTATATTTALPKVLAISRSGDGVAALGPNAAPLFLDLFNLTSGALIRSIPFPTASSGSNRKLNVAGNAVMNGLLSVSADGNNLVTSGYDAPVGQSIVMLTDSTAFPRVVGIIDNSGNVDTTTSTTAYNATDIRGVALAGDMVYFGGGPGPTGTTLWGLLYNRRGGSGLGTTLTLNPTSFRYLAIFNNQLWHSNSVTGFFGAGTIGVGLPSAPITGQATQFLANTTSPYGIAVVNRTGTTSVYMCNDLAQPMGGLRKYTDVGAPGLWPMAWWIRSNNFPGCRSIAALESDTGVRLYAVASNGTILTASDPDGNTVEPVWSVFLPAAGTNKYYRGIATFGFRL